MNKLQTQDLYQFRVTLSRDAKTGQTIVQVPALDIADYGMDSPEALSRLQEMLAFHLECLISEGKSVPRDEGQEDGLYLQVRLPVGAS